VNENLVISALEEQVTCYRRLARLAEAQHEHVQQMHMEPLLEVLKNRQEVLDRLQVLESVIGPAMKRWTDFLSEVQSDQRARAEEIVGETKRLLEQIMAADRNDTFVLQQRKVNLGQQINQAASARQINRNYATSAYGSRRASHMDVQR
jgi:hypothetical protein